MADIPSNLEPAIVTPKKKVYFKVCRYFKKGFCGFGEKCLFRHCKPKGRSDFFSNNPSDVENCRFYKKASCKFASKCWYNHIRPNGKIYPKPDPINKFIVVGPFGDEPEETEEAVIPVADAIAIPAHETERHMSFQRPQNQDIVHKKCFYYEKKGTCYYGDKCWYIHSELPADEYPELDPDFSKMCYNFIFAECEYGNECPYVHGDVCQFCDLAFLHPFDEHQRSEHLEACEIFFLEDMEIAFQTMVSKDKTCAICLEYVWGSNKLYGRQKFGIQDECNHIFCLDCIRRWRNLKRKEKEKLCCPACRVESQVVVPCLRWFKCIDEKNEWVAVYKAAVKRRTCKFYAKGNCQNEGNCPYLHLGYIPPLKKKRDEGIWENVESNNELPSGSQQGPSNLTEGWQDINGGRDLELNNEAPPGEQEGPSNLAEGWEDINDDRNLKSNNEVPSSEQEDPSKLAEGWEDINDDRDQENANRIDVQYSEICDDMQPEDQSTNDFVLESGVQVGASDLAEEHQFDVNLGQVSIGDGANERDREIRVQQDPDFRDDTPLVD